MVDSPSTIIGPFVVGEKPAPLEYQFLDDEGNAINLSGYTARFSCAERGAPTVTKTNVVATITDATAGKVTYTWDGTEFPTPGRYRAELWVGNTTNRFASLLLLFTVRAPVATVPPI